jgi:hypothetical protein
MAARLAIVCGFLDKVRISLNVVCVAGLVLAGFTAWHNHVKRKTERAEA